MKELVKLFDTYSLNARVKPAFLLVFPIVVSIFVLYEPSRSWGGAVITFITSFGIISFASNQMSTRGNRLQERLFDKWGGAPTTIILRYSDNRLDKHTKSRYMSKLEALIPNFSAITPQQESNSIEEADEMYRTAALFMREHTRDIKSYPLVFKENISYGFSRNIRAFKWLGVVISLSSICFSGLVIWYMYIKSSELPFLDLLFKIPFEKIGLLLILMVSLILWLFVVTEKWVEIRAFAYARALFAACEK